MSLDVNGALRGLLGSSKKTFNTLNYNQILNEVQVEEIWDESMEHFATLCIIRTVHLASYSLLE